MWWQFRRAMGIQTEKEEKSKANKEDIEND